jgi:hypothetical protein
VFLLDHLSLVVSASERNKMSAQALATALGPPLMLHSSGGGPADAEIDHAQPIAVLKYLLQIWPQPATGSNVSGNVVRLLQCYTSLPAQHTNTHTLTDSNTRRGATIYKKAFSDSFKI